ncbi:MAG TPA: glycosyltransferase [Candidatus Limnocylindria bacterium]|nr:glycosyltransferase [Candidatus Limnocylindria bacterium]
MTAVHQFHPVLAPGDAMSNHIFALRDRLRSWGYEADAYAVEVKPGVDALSYRRLFRAVRPEDTLILHFSIGNEVFDQLVKIPARRVLVYHNVTPPEFFSGINDHAAAFARLGLRQLEGLAPKIDLAIGVSAFNRQDLDDLGFRRTAHVPILIDWSLYDTAPDPAVLARWSVFDRKLLFVGRVSPNKRHDDLLRMFAYYRSCVDREAHLLLVGSYRDQPAYYARLRELQRALGLEGAVTFTGSVSLAALCAYYREADCFVSLSEHEGFGVPLLEAMRFDVPVVAYDAAAVGETVDGAGVLLETRDLAEAAEACALVSEDAALRANLAEAGRRRLRDFDTQEVAERTREVLGL